MHPFSTEPWLWEDEYLEDHPRTRKWLVAHPHLFPPWSSAIYKGNKQYLGDLHITMGTVDGWNPAPVDR